MSYLDKVLQPGERVLVRARPHWVVLLSALVVLALAAMLAIATFVVLTGVQSLAGYAVAGLVGVYGLLALLGGMVARSTTEFCVTDHRVIVKRGLISLHTVEMNVDKVESVDVDQTIVGRMLGYGAVTIHGVGARWDPIPQITDPLGFRNAITTRAAPAGAA